MRKGTLVVTRKVRFSYAQVFKPVAMEEGGKKKYSVSILIDKDDDTTVNEVKEAIKEAVTLGKAKLGNMSPAKVIEKVMRDGDEERPDDDTYANKYFINAKSDNQPGIIDRAKKYIYLDEEYAARTRNKTDKEIEEIDADRSDEEFYSGCYGRASINFYAFKVPSNKGVACGLNNLQKLEDGPNLGGGRTDATDDFGDDYEDDF